MHRKVGILAIDLGTTNCKAAVFDEGGRVLGIATSGYSFRTQADSLEHDETYWRRALKGCVRQALGSCGTTPSLVAITGQASSAVCLDEKGRLVSPILSHLDRRNLGEHLWALKEIENLGYPPSRLFATLAWMKKRRRGDFVRINHVLDVREYVGFMLTGERRYESAHMKPSEMERLRGLIGFDPMKFGTPHDYLTPYGYASERASREFGLEQGAPVYVGPADGICGALGSGVVDEGVCADVSGSTEVIASPVPAHSGLGLVPYLVEGMWLFYTSPPFGVAYRKLGESLLGVLDDRKYRELDVLASKVSPGCDGMLYVPLATLQGYVSDYSGHFFGISTNHTRGHLVRAVMEGLAFELSERIREGELRGLRVRTIVASGGGAKSGLWNQIKADVTGKRVLVPQVLETTCLGAAIIAAVASGTHEDIRRAARKMVKTSATFAPRATNHQVYLKQLERYRAFLAALNTTQEETGPSEP
jgi:xylulokinase